MKRIAAFIISIMLCFTFCLTAFADNIYIVDDQEAEFVPDIQPTTVPETTTASSGESIFGDMGSFEDMFGGLKEVIGGGIDSLLGELGDGFGDLNFDFGTETTTAGDKTQLPSINNQDAPTQSNQAQQMVDSLPESTTAAEVPTQSNQAQQEVASVLIVNNGSSDDDGINGSTLTLLVFIGAIVLLILVAAIVLVIMTRRTEYNSSVLDKSTIPSVEKPSGMSHLMNDNIKDDGNDYGNITYWNE